MSIVRDLQVKRLCCVSDLAQARDRWNQLAAGVPFRSFHWLECWWQAYGQARGRELFVLGVVDSNDRLLGLAPWFIDRVAGLRIVRFLGSGEVCSDYLTVLAERGREAHVACALADWLSLAASTGVDENTCWDQIELGSVYDHDKTMAPLVARLAANENLIHRRERSSCWRVPLPATWDDYLAMLSKSHRKHIRKLERTYLQTPRVRLHYTEDEASLEYGLEVFRRLHQKRRASLRQKGCFASPRFADFLTRSAKPLLHNRQLRIAWLELDGREVAAEYQILGDGVVYAYQSGMEPDALEHQPGRLALLSTMRKAIEEGRHAFDFLRGDEEYKAHWRAVPRPTHDIRIVANTARARVPHTLWLAGDSVKRWLKSGLGLTGSLPN